MFSSFKWRMVVVLYAFAGHYKERHILLADRFGCEPRVVWRISLFLCREFVFFRSQREPQIVNPAFEGSKATKTRMIDFTADPPRPRRLCAEKQKPAR